VGLTVETFIAKCQGAEGGQERANYALFLTELCTVLGLATPDPASATTEHNDYVFEYSVTFRNPEKPRPSFPQGAVEQTAAVMAGIAATSAPLSAAELAQQFKQGRKSEARIAATLASLVRAGFISSLDGRVRFTLRRAA
jgi:hypothetical protein